MAADDPLQVRVGHPMPSAQHAPLLASSELLLASAATTLPARIPGRPRELFFQDWELTRAAFIARMASTLRHLGYLAPSFSQLDGAALTRTLLDHCITFAWVSADPASRLPRFLRSNYSRALDKHREMARRGEVLLSDDLKARYREYVRTHTDNPPGLPRLASEGDEGWLDRVRSATADVMQFPSLTDLYDDVYDHYANLDHPSVTALQHFVHLDQASPAAVVDGDPERDFESDLRPYWIAIWCMSWALMVSSLATGEPRQTDLTTTLSRIRILREYDRHGLLSVTERDGLMTIDVVADADARIDEIVRDRDDPIVE